MNKRRLIRRLEGSKALAFMTLTCNPQRWGTPIRSFAGMSLAVNHLMKRIRRSWPQAELEYFLVWETTAKGFPHAHLLLRAPYIPQRWLSRNWRELTGAPIVDIRSIGRALDVGSYIAKYLTKDTHVPAGMKRYRCSRGFFTGLLHSPADRSNGVTNWSLSPSEPASIAQSFSNAGYTVRASPDGSYTCYPPGSQPSLSLLDQFTPTLQPSPPGVAA